MKSPSSKARKVGCVTPCVPPLANQRVRVRPRRRAERRALHSRAEIPERLKFLFRAGDDDGVKAEQKSGEQGNDGPKEKALSHWLV